MSFSNLDPITIEIIQNRLTQIGREAGIALVRAAASLIVVGAKDLGFNISDHLGRTIVYSIWMPRHGTTLSYMLKSCLARFGNNVQPGDMFMVNNPYDGSLHALDIAVIAPVHYHGDLIAWTGCATHHLDIRAMRPGTAPDATDWYQEGIIFRPIKIVEKGILREDIFGLFLDNVRVPLYQGLDLKGQIAANNTAVDKMVKLAARYGPGVLKRCYQEIIDFSEAKTRERISLLPEGEYQAAEYLDYDKAYLLKCTLKVRREHMTFDFSGTEPQAGSYINSALACTVANVHNIIICQLLPDVPANEGCFRAVDIIVPEGTVLNSKPPAPCGGASTLGGWKAQVLAIKVLSQAMAGSPLSWRANASWGSGFVMPRMSGLGHDGRPYVLGLTESMMQGGGARMNKDGFDVANIAGSTNTSIPNIEDTESRYPFLYLKRGMSQDSGGAGKYRGGLAGEAVVKLHDAASAECSLGYTGRDFPADGFAGGKGGLPALVKLQKNSDVNALLKQTVPDFHDIAGEEIAFPQRNPPFSLSPDDVLFLRCQGGGGVGDPKERDRDRVQADLEEGYISENQARKEYGAQKGAARGEK
ncbi:MAG: hydantoinase B/oxoprolinase family protein [Chloroflexi bacterium]|nr:hydantoinase B/oxoprolinase family protein [Chloroflexota bacterium]